MVEEISRVTSLNLLIISITVLIIVCLIFTLLWFRGAKASFGGKTVEISGSDGEIQQTDQFGLMYIMNDACHLIEDKKKERIDSIIPDLSYKINTISNLSCVNLKAESTLQNRRRKNGFEKLTSKRSYEEYVEDLTGELVGKTRLETERMKSCSTQEVKDIETDIVRDVTEAFTLRAIKACADEYAQKAEMYRMFSPQFEILKDKTRVSFCQQKIKKHDERCQNLTFMLEVLCG